MALIKGLNLKKLFGKLTPYADDVARGVSNYGDDALRLASNYGGEALDYGMDVAKYADVLDNSGRALMSPELLGDDFLDAVDDYARVSGKPKAFDLTPGRVAPPPDIKSFTPSASDEAYLTNLMTESGLINKYNSPSDAMFHTPSSIYRSDLYQTPWLKGINLPWLDDVDDFRRDLVAEADGNTLRVLELNDPYANIGQIDFKDGAEGFIQNAEILKYLDTLPDNVSEQDASTLKRLFRRSQHYINSKFNKYGADAIEHAEQFGVPLGDFDWNGVREINRRTAPYWNY